MAVRSCTANNSRPGAPSQPVRRSTTRTYGVAMIGASGLALMGSQFGSPLATQPTSFRHPRCRDGPPRRSCLASRCTPASPQRRVWVPPGLACLKPAADRGDAGVAASSWGDGPSWERRAATPAEMVLGSTVVVVVGAVGGGDEAAGVVARWAAVVVLAPMFDVASTPTHAAKPRMSTVSRRCQSCPGGWGALRRKGFTTSADSTGAAACWGRAARLLNALLTRCRTSGGGGRRRTGASPR
jgi:hypothetical protein